MRNYEKRMEFHGYGYTVKKEFFMKIMTMDGNTAASYVSYAFSELAFIYPISPASPMAELADKWQTEGKINIFGTVPKVVQMQSESGAAGAIHGALNGGALTTTYTCSQGLLLMLPNMYKIAGELLPTVFHVSARALATHALSIFGDHQDVMACRQSGFAMLASASVQEVMDLALVAHLATLRASVPFLHFFDGFRTSHEVNKIEVLAYEEMRSLLSVQDIENFKKRALNPDKPVQRGTAQNPDIYFQNRERANPFHLAIPSIVQSVMDEVAKITKRAYHVFDYCGFNEAENVVVIMGSGAQTMEQTIQKYNQKGGKTGLIKVRLYRPFDKNAFLSALPKTCKKIAVLDRTKEAGATGEPLYLDVCALLKEANRTDILVVGGRYGLGMKEFTPSMCYAVLKNLEREQPKNHFTVGICDDVTFTSLDISQKFNVDYEGVSCKFYGLGSDGTVGANKNSVEIIGNHTKLFTQAYFMYDSKKSGGITISHLRFGNTPIHAPYLIDYADFIACHNPSYLVRYDMLSELKNNGTFLLNCPHQTLDELEQALPYAVKNALAQKNARFFVIDGTKIANDLGLKGRHSTIMQAAFFLLNPSIMPYETAKNLLKSELKQKFSRKGERIVEMNCSSVDKAEESLKEIRYPDAWKTTKSGKAMLDRPKNEYFQSFMSPILSLNGDDLPVSAFSADGTVPTGTAKLEKSGVAFEIPQWIAENCIQCNQCAFVCPHATIRPFLLEEAQEKPNSFITKPAFGIPNKQYRIQVAAHDCKGCGVCAHTCPAKDKALIMRPATELLPQEGENWEFAQSLPQTNTEVFKRNTVKGSQFYPPLFEFSYACAGCGETPYIKLLTQLFGERMVIANATGCSSIYGGSAPSCPYTVNHKGQGPAWANSLFEDNAEFGLGIKLGLATGQAEQNRSIWIIGGDGWAYDIGYGGLDHVLASGENVNILVLDSEVYSNTGGQQSKATPISATAKFAMAGKSSAKKNLGLMAMTYGRAYVAQVCMGANKQQLLNALIEAEAFDGPSLIIAYSPCIAHGYPLNFAQEHEKLAVECGYWNLYRFNPTLQRPFTLDSPNITADFQEFLQSENRFATLQRSDPNQAKMLQEQAEKESKLRLALYQKLSEIL